MGNLFQTVTDDSHRTSYVYYRIVTVLKVKNRIQIGQIYHYDEVSIRDSDNQLTIEEVKYIFCESKTQKDESTKRTYRKVRLDRFVSFPEADEKEQFMERHMYHREKINYRLDKELWKLSNAEETGVTIQVQSHFDRTINIDYSSSFITCLKIEDNPVANPKFNSKICSNMGSEVEEMKYVDVSEFPALKQVSQEVWRCTGAEDFIIVQNKMISTDLRMRVYHRPPATAVGTLFLPNGGKALQISDQRFLKEEQRGDGEYEYKVIKFLGSMNLVLETLPEADTFPKHTIAVPLRILAKRTSRHIWTLDSLRLVAFRDLQLARHLISAVHYTGNINQQYLHTKILDSGASRMFQLGRFYDKVLNAEDLHQRKPLECIQCPWDSKYTPTVTEYVGMHSYTMDKETFYENFQVINVAVWLCSNKFNELLRVRTVYEPKQEMPIFAVRYTDGIEVEVSKDGKKLIRVNEILYIDVLALDVYRYDGRLKERILPPITPVTESDSESETENYEEDLVILNKPLKHLGSNAAAIRATGVKSVKTIIGLFRCLTPYFKKPKRGNSKKPPQSPPVKPKA
ncbi:uncharacterized protein LOC111046348 [Nilaparvata lugens]|uniref:uncharacterized protein LOC111046348 n=1 Tax=Nilaparvata lugens TaxID=108931 RepID=UPI00193D1225|nr:uncharacterized protein LOC111046348 [Nilaparvata lugens]